MEGGKLGERFELAIVMGRGGPATTRRYKDERAGLVRRTWR